MGRPFKGTRNGNAIAKIMGKYYQHPVRFPTEREKQMWGEEDINTKSSGRDYGDENDNLFPKHYTNGYKEQAVDVQLDPTSKPSNPKDAIGSDKIPHHLWPVAATILGTLGLTDGMLKYGRANWRAAGVRFSIYYDAIKRHMDAMNEGEWVDPDSGLPHLSHVLASAAIISDAWATNNLIDDRQYEGGFYRAFIDRMTSHVSRLKAKHKGNNPKHWTIKDNNDRAITDDQFTYGGLGAGTQSNGGQPAHSDRPQAGSVDSRRNQTVSQGREDSGLTPPKRGFGLPRL